MPTLRGWSVFLLGAGIASCTTPWPREPQVVLLSAPVSLSYDESRTDWLWAGRIVDALTGKPIPSAVLYRVQERNHPEGGRFWSDGQWHADRDGFVRIPQQARPGGGWWFVQAPGYGPTASIDCPNQQVTPLMPGIDLPVAVRDNLDRPVPDAEVGYCIGCGHTPDVRVATTDAGGLATIRCIEPLGDIAEGDGIRDLYVRRSGLSGSYDEFHWRRGDPPVVLRQGRVADIVGRVTSLDGKPMAAVAVGGSLHRGPWAWTDRDGTFHHVGRETADDGLQFVFGETAYVMRMPAAPRPIEVTLPPAELPAEGLTGSLSVTVRDARTGQPIEGATIRAWLPTIVSARDAETDDDTSDEHGRGTLDLVSGRFDLVVGTGSGTHETAVRRVDVTGGREAHVAVDLEPRVLVPVDVDGWDEPECLLATETSEHRIQLAGLTSLPLPLRGPFALRVRGSDHDNERWFRFDSLPNEPLVLRPFADTTVQGRVVDARGAPLSARVALAHHADGRERHGGPIQETDWLTTSADGSFRLTTVRTGCAFLVLRPSLSGHRPRVVHLSLPPRGDLQAVDCGRIVLPTTDSPRLRVLGGDGAPAAGHLRLVRPGLVDDGALAEDGGWDGLDPQAGDRVSVTIDADDSRDATRRVPLEEVLAGKGPWTLRPPDTTLTLDVRDPAGKPIADFVVVFRGHEFDDTGDDGTLALRDVPPGPVELFVGAEKLQSARVRLTLASGERRVLSLVLPNR